MSLSARFDKLLPQPNLRDLPLASWCAAGFVK
jgi:hypothetical protein